MHTMKATGCEVYEVLAVFLWEGTYQISWEPSIQCEAASECVMKCRCRCESWWWLPRAFGFFTLQMCIKALSVAKEDWEGGLGVAVGGESPVWWKGPQCRAGVEGLFCRLRSSAKSTLYFVLVIFVTIAEGGETESRDRHCNREQSFPCIAE